MSARGLFLVMSCVLALFPLQVAQAQTQAEFRAWTERTLKPRALAAGISPATVTRVTQGLSLDLSLPDLGRSPAKPQRQSEFGSPGRYFSQANLDALVAGGRTRLKRWASTLDAIERRYGVPRGIIVAIWGRESNFGEAAITRDAIRTLASQAFAGARKDLFLGELLAALQIIEQGHVTAPQMKSSWAGALGQPQFLPSKFLDYAVDFDGDGRRDIWGSVPDTLASIANYLASHGWQSGRDWGFEAKIPQTISCTLEGPDQGRPIRDFIAMGARRVSGRPFPSHEVSRKGYLLMPAGRFGPAFIATPNFYTLKTYNESDLYALFIGHLADRFSNNKPFAAGWDAVGGFSRAAVAAMQHRLEARGVDVGGADGLVGYKTRIAIGRWQERNGMAATCLPDKALVERIR